MSTTPPRRSTRARNSLVHPGIPDAKRKRRTRAEVEHEQQAKEGLKVAARQKQRESIKRISVMEKQMVEEDEMVTQTPANRPRPLSRERTLVLDEAHDGGEQNRELTTSNAEPHRDQSEGSQTSVGTDLELQRTTAGTSKKPRRPIKRQYADIFTTDDGDSQAGEPPPGPKDERSKKHGRFTARQAIMDAVSDSGQDLEANEAASNKGYTQVVAKRARAVTSRKKLSGIKDNRETMSQLDNTAARKATTLGSRPSSGVEAAGVSVRANAFSELDDEDDNQEREEALSSPIKGHQRLTSGNIVAIKQVHMRGRYQSEPQVASERAKSGDNKPESEGSKRKKYRNDDLPEGAMDTNLWQGIYVPTYLSYMASYLDPWVITDDDSRAAMRTIWKRVYDGKSKNNRDITINNAVFYIANQRVYEYRSSFGATAVAILNNYFSAYGDAYKSEDIRQEFATTLLQDHRFLYSDTKAEDPKKWRGLFQSSIILQVFATHFTAVEGCVKISESMPGVRVHDSDMFPRAALSLSCAAVERALTLCRDGMSVLSLDGDDALPRSRNPMARVPKGLNRSTGRESLKAHAFGYVNWGAECRGYMKSINVLKARSWEKIIRLAQEHVMPKAGRAPSSRIAGCGDDDDDPRALLVNLSDLDEAETDVQLSP